MGQFGDSRVHASVPVLEPPWDVHGPTVITEMPADLPHHGRDRERDERRTLGWIEAIHRLHQAQPRDLCQVFDVLAAAPVVASDAVGKVQAAVEDQLALANHFRGFGDGELQGVEHLLDVAVLVDTGRALLGFEVRVLHLGSPKRHPRVRGGRPVDMS